MHNEVIRVNDKELTAVEWNGERVITTVQLADVYGTDVNNVRNNYSNHKDRFEEGKHYFLLVGDSLRSFKSHINDIDVVSRNTSQLYLWTRRGASRHCKILDTEKAWEQFDCLEENYFNPHKTQTTITYQYPLSASTFDSVANLGRLVERVMKAEGACPHEIALVLKPIFQQAGIEIRDCFIKIPAYEQMALDIVTR